MKWLPGGWQRTQRIDERATVPRGRADRGTARLTAPGERIPEAARGGRRRPVLLGPGARDVDVSASSFRTFLLGGGISGLVAVLCAANLAYQGNSVGAWLLQLVSAVVFGYFLVGSRGMLNSRGFLFDRSGFYARTKGEVFGVAWDEIAAVGVSTLSFLQARRVVSPERRVALEFFPADPGFAERHPELDRWLVEEPPPMPDLPYERYRFYLPPISRLPKALEAAVQEVAGRKWIGQYRRELPVPVDA
ncbi:hypothetical protein [Saccharopolyspora rectivirgula]|jgi:hypothetical protein|uniref:Uncharacterized protein n=1 Tax=Saccharopolyspora rectivirgula TaxID=28042 RepID=A0A073AUQ9_9PSEU|nr:hypothetical protein [Saccharopolyspora rectivirgula]KEI43076.1 hypothetical protein GU90_18285 [Saccharopolyspora rectivirgula]